jgi:hypothetical protein
MPTVHPRWTTLGKHLNFLESLVSSVEKEETKTCPAYLMGL